MLVQKFLGDQEIELLTADDGLEAVDLVRIHTPDIVLMDMSMPEMDGPEATRVIRRMGVPQPRIIALTANAYDTDREICIKAGMDAFLTKPIRKAGLIREIAAQGLALRQQPPVPRPQISNSSL